MKEFISEALDERDLTLIDNWRNTILYEDNNCSYVLNKRCPIEDLLIPWANAKSQFLYQLLGNKVIISRYIKIEKDTKLLVRDFDKKSAPIIHSFFSRIQSTLTATNPNVSYFETLGFYNSLFGSDNIVSNVYNGDTFVIKNKYDEYLKIQKGTKLMKVYRSVIEFYHLENDLISYFGTSMTVQEAFIYLRNFQSQIRNDAYLEGTLSLSIHPLDYMTMSDNDCDWDSCMRWRDGGGDYRQGTIEMMNSPYVIVAYLESKKPFIYGNTTWNNKKWRQLFVVSRDCIAAVKGYPYQNNNLCEYIIDWLTSLAKDNLGWEYLPDLYEWYDTNNIVNCKTGLRASDGNLTYVQFATCNMYNDFGTLPYHYIKLATENLHIVLDYSGPSQCMICGKTDFENGGATELIACFDCSEDPNHYCANCGNRIDEDDLYRFDDWDSNEEYCEECFYDLGINCPICGYYVHNSNTIPMYCFESSKTMEEIIQEQKEDNVLVASVCKDCIDKVPKYIFGKNIDQEEIYAVYDSENNITAIVAKSEDVYKSTFYSHFYWNEMLSSHVFMNLENKTFQRIY